eukprot:jgi/Botrbrau1/22259/Bobra.0138s0021.1
MSARRGFRDRGRGYQGGRRHFDDRGRPRGRPYGGEPPFGGPAGPMVPPYSYMDQPGRPVGGFHRQPPMHGPMYPPQGPWPPHPPLHPGGEWGPWDPHMGAIPVGPPIMVPHGPPIGPPPGYPPPHIVPPHRGAPPPWQPVPIPMPQPPPVPDPVRSQAEPLVSAKASPGEIVDGSESLAPGVSPLSSVAPLPSDAAIPPPLPEEAAPQPSSPAPPLPQEEPPSSPGAAASQPAPPSATTAPTPTPGSASKGPLRITLNPRLAGGTGSKALGSAKAENKGGAVTSRDLTPPGKTSAKVLFPKVAAEKPAVPDETLRVPPEVPEAVPMATPAAPGPAERSMLGAKPSSPPRGLSRSSPSERKHSTSSRSRDRSPRKTRSPRSTRSPLSRSPDRPAYERRPFRHSPRRNRPLFRRDLDGDRRWSDGMERPRQGREWSREGYRDRPMGPGHEWRRDRQGPDRRWESRERNSYGAVREGMAVQDSVSRDRADGGPIRDWVPRDQADGGHPRDGGRHWSHRRRGHSPVKHSAPSTQSPAGYPAGRGVPHSPLRSRISHLGPRRPRVRAHSLRRDHQYHRKLCSTASPR